MTGAITKNLTDSEKLDFLINAVSDNNRRLALVEERQTALEQLVRDRLYDTRPLWQAVVQRLDAQQQDIEAIKQDVEQIKAQQQDVRAHQKRHDEMFTQVRQRLAVLNDDVPVVRGGHRESRERVELLEAA